MLPRRAVCRRSAARSRAQHGSRARVRLTSGAGCRAEAAVLRCAALLCSAARWNSSVQGAAYGWADGMEPRRRSRQHRRGRRLRKGYASSARRATRSSRLPRRVPSRPPRAAASPPAISSAAEPRPSLLTLRTPSPAPAHPHHHPHRTSAALGSTRSAPHARQLHHLHLSHPAQHGPCRTFCRCLGLGPRIHLGAAHGCAV
jgi:hypothetical protein